MPMPWERRLLWRVLRPVAALLHRAVLRTGRRGTVAGSARRRSAHARDGDSGRSTFADERPFQGVLCVSLLPLSTSRVLSRCATSCERERSPPYMLAAVPRSHVL